MTIALGTIAPRARSDAASVGGLVAWLFGLAPAMLFALTWSDDLGDMQRMARAYALPVVWVELAVILIAFHQGIRLPKPRPVPLALLGALGILVWMAALGADAPATGLLRTGIWTIHLFFALAIINLWRAGMFDPGQHLRAISWGFLAFFALLIAFVATIEQSAEERIFNLPAFGNIRWFGYYSAGVIGLCAAGFLRGNRFALIVASIAFAMAFWTGSRGAIAAAVVGLIACAILFREFRSGRAWLLFALCGLAGFACAFALDALVPMGGQGPDSMGRYSDSGRIEVWRATIELIRMRPWFGHGDGQFQLLLGQNFMIAQPHNIVLQLLYSWGIAGTLICLALTVWAAPAFLKDRAASAAPFQCGALMLGAYSFIDGALFYNQSLSLFALCCAAAIAAGMPPHSPDRTSGES